MFVVFFVFMVYLVMKGLLCDCIFLIDWFLVFVGSFFVVYIYLFYVEFVGCLGVFI